MSSRSLYSSSTTITVGTRYHLQPQVSARPSPRSSQVTSEAGFFTRVPDPLLAGAAVETTGGVLRSRPFEPNLHLVFTSIPESLHIGGVNSGEACARGSRRPLKCEETSRWPKLTIHVMPLSP